MAHNPYHIDTTYDTTAQSNQPSNNYVTDTLGYDFNQPIMGEDGTKYAEFFDPYDPQKERFAEQGNALQTAFFNEQQGFLESGTQNQLKDLTNNTPYTGFNNSGAIERSTQRSRDDIMRGYNTGLDSLNFQRANNQLGFEQDIYGYREDYKDKQRQTLLDLIQSDADIDPYHSDYEGDYWNESEQSDNQLRSSLPSAHNFGDGHTITQNGYQWTINNGNWEKGNKVG